MRLRQPNAIQSDLDLNKWTPEARDRAIEQFTLRLYKNRPGGCWAMGDSRSYWPSSKKATFYWRGATHSARQFSYVLHRAPISAGMYLWSVCGIPNCVNPAHLLYGSRQEMERWYKNRPRLSPEQIEEARYLFRQQHKQVHELRQRYRLTDGEMRKVLGL